ncbi:hypothetical protein ACHWQZ_G008592 [Mnemiopsis leidyi]
MSLSKDEEMLRECDEYIARLRLSIDMRIAKMRDINDNISSDQIWTLISHSLETFSLLDTAQQYEEFVHSFNKRIRDKNTTLDTISFELNERAQPNEDVLSDNLVEHSSEMDDEATSTTVKRAQKTNEISIHSNTGKSSDGEKKQDLDDLPIPPLPSSESSEAEIENTPFRKSLINGKEALHPNANMFQGQDDEKHPIEQFSNRLEPSLSGNSLTEACYTTSLRTLIQQDPKLQGTPLRYAAISKLCELRIRAEKMLESLSPEEVETCFKTKHVQLEKRLRNSAV